MSSARAGEFALHDWSWLHGDMLGSDRTGATALSHSLTCNDEAPANQPEVKDRRMVKDVACLI